MSYYIHLLIEAFCSYDWGEEEEEKPVPDFCKKGIGSPGFHCLRSNCPFFRFTNCPFELAYAGEHGEVPSTEHWIGFGGDMEPKVENDEERNKFLSQWEQICKRKVGEAYNEYMEMKNKEVG